MTRDWLREATTALSESGHQQASGKFTRERIVSTLHDNQRRGRSRRALLLPLAAIFVGSTAFAGVNGSLSKVFRSALDAAGFASSEEVALDVSESDASPRRPGASALEGRPQAAKLPKEEPPTAEIEKAPEPTPSAEPRPPGAALEAVPSTVVQPKVADGHELYRQGHRAHFKEGDHARALEAYDAYLKQQPNGRFAVDARYNRALCLVRLGRHAEAEESLGDFARGEYGEYRQEDARRLLEALER